MQYYRVYWFSKSTQNIFPTTPCGFSGMRTVIWLHVFSQYTLSSANRAVFYAKDLEIYAMKIPIDARNVHWFKEKKECVYVDNNYTRSKRFWNPFVPILMCIPIAINRTQPAVTMPRDIVMNEVKLHLCSY